MIFPVVVIKLPRTTTPRERVFRHPLGRDFLYHHLFSENQEEYGPVSEVSVWGFAGDLASEQALAFAKEQAGRDMNSIFMVCHGHSVISIAPGEVVQSTWSERGLLPT